jgi:hypothetical protein
LTLLDANGKLPNGSRISHPSERWGRRNYNHRWNSMTIQKILPTRRGPREPHHSHKLFGVAAKMGLKPGRLYWRRRHRHHLSVVPANLHPKTRKMEPSRGQGLRSTPPSWPEGHIIGADRRGRREAAGNPKCLMMASLVAYMFMAKLMPHLIPRWHYFKIWCLGSV